MCLLCLIERRSALILCTHGRNDHSCPWQVQPGSSLTGFKKRRLKFISMNLDRGHLAQADAAQGLRN